VIITDCLSTILAAESRTPTKNPKTQTTTKMLDHEGTTITLIWVPSHKGIPGNEKADQAAKRLLDEDTSTTERYPQRRSEEMVDRRGLQKRVQRWKNGNNEMIEKETGRRQKGGYKRNTKKITSGNI
jgi:hypothetical protein